MSELKTLKDIKCFLSSPKCPVMVMDTKRNCKRFSEYELKELAIKWIKFFDNGMKKGDEIDQVINNLGLGVAKTSFIDFFDISEDDLK